MTKGKLKAFLSQRYKGYVAQRIVQFFDFSTNFDYDKFIDEIETLLNLRSEVLLKMAFSIYDFDQNKFICELDLYTLLKTYEHDDDLFIKAYSSDISTLESAIAKKRGGRPQSKVEEAFKLKEIDKRMQKLGGRLQLKVLLDIEENAQGRDDFAEVDQLSDSNSDETAADRTNFKRQVTTRSRGSRRSRRSKSSKRSNRSRKSNASSVNSDGSLEGRPHPYDSVFGQKVNKSMQGGVPLPKLTFADFSKIQFKNEFPCVVVDMIEYLSGYSIPEYERIRNATLQIKEKQRVYEERFKEELSRNPDLEHETFVKRFVIGTKTAEQLALDEL